MARSNYRGGTSRRAPKDLNRRIKKKPCALCRDGVDWVDYKDVPLLRKFMSDRGKIRSRRVTGNCAQHQRDVAEAIKTARELVLLPYTQRTVTERPGTRGGRDRGERGERTERGPGGAGAPANGERGFDGQGDANVGDGAPPDDAADASLPEVTETAAAGSDVEAASSTEGEEP